MIRLASVIDSFEKDFRAQYRDRLNAGHLQALAAIRRCRTEAAQKIQVQCSGCDHQKLVPHSCGHRHCPHCQHHESQQWLERQIRKQVPAEYFLRTFTLPAQFRPLAFAHKALAKVFRAKLLAALAAAGLTLPVSYPGQWVVDCKSVGSGAKALVYLGRYLYRGVIRENDIVACANGEVTFRYRDAKSGTMMRRSVPGAQFLWLVLQHVLPKGFRRARNFGFLHPNCKRLIALLHLLLKFDPARTLAWIKPRAPFLCSCCGAVMTIVRTRIRSLIAGAVPMPQSVEGAR